MLTELFDNFRISQLETFNKDANSDVKQLFDRKILTNRMYQQEEGRRMTLISGTFLLILTFILYNSAFSRQKKGWVCENYILNNYMYVMIALTSIFFFIGVQEWSGTFSLIPRKYGAWGMLIIGLVLGIASIVMIHRTSKNRIVLKHLLWLVFLIAQGIILYPLYIIGRFYKVFFPAMFTLIGVVLSLTLLAFLKPEWINLRWYKIAFFALIGLIIFHIVFLFILYFDKRPIAIKINKKTNTVVSIKNKYKWVMVGLAILGIVIFTYLLLADTKRIQIEAIICNKSNDLPDYVKTSLGLILDIVNMFIRIMSLMMRGKEF